MNTEPRCLMHYGLINVALRLKKNPKKNPRKQQRTPQKTQSKMKRKRWTQEQMRKNKKQQRNLQLKKMNCKLNSSHLDPVWRGNVKFISFGRDLFWMCPPPPHPQPLSPLHCKMLGLWSQEEVGFLVEFF